MPGKAQNKKEDLAIVFNGVKGTGVLDYVAAWYVLAAKYMKQSQILKRDVFSAFVSTNSITQGEQVSILGKELIENYNVTYLFAHQTFKWANEAKGNAGVSVVIIGFWNNP
jgi:hypothetical protein